MKVKNNLATLILIISISLAVSYFVGKAFIKEPEDRQAEVEVVTPITAEFPSPNEDPLSEKADKIYNVIFVDDAINPTELIQIGGSTSDSPFTSGEQ